MSLMYNLVFALFSAECSLLTFFLLPIPLSMRKQALKFLSTNAIVGQILYAARIAMIGVALLFLDAWRVVYSESSQTPEEDMDVMGKKASAKSSDHHHHYGVPFEPHARLWRAQRNLYLTGFTLFLALIIYRFFGTLLELQQNEERVGAIRKQTEGARKEYDRILEEVGKKDIKIKELLEKDEELRAETKKAKANAEAMETQSRNLQKAYEDLSDRFNALERKSGSGGSGGKAD